MLLLRSFLICIISSDHVQNGPDKIPVSQEYLHGLRVALDTERRRVEELEAEVCRLNKELEGYRVSMALFPPIETHQSLKPWGHTSSAFVQ